MAGEQLSPLSARPYTMYHRRYRDRPAVTLISCNLKARAKVGYTARNWLNPSRIDRRRSSRRVFDPRAPNLDWHLRWPIMIKYPDV